MFRKFGYAVVAICFASALLVLFPFTSEKWSEVRTVKTFEYDHPKYTKEEALKSIQERMEYLVRHRSDLDVKTAHDNLVFVNQLDTFGPHDEDVAVNRSDLARMNMETYQWMVSKGKIPSRAIEALRNNDPAWRSMRQPTEETIHWNVLRDHVAKMIPFSAAFAIVGLIGLIELWGLSKVMRVAWLTLSFLLSVSGGAVAQTVKKMTGKKEGGSTQTLQIDARVSIYAAEGPPNPGIFLRVTNSGGKGVVENISIWNPRTKAWTTDIVGGLWLPGTGRTRVLAAGYFTEASGANARTGAGIQIFRAGSQGLLAIPVLRWERQIHGPPLHSFVVAPNPNIKFGRSRWSIAPDIMARKTQGRPWLWQVGAGVRFTTGRHQVEEGWLVNQAGVAQLRTRLISTFAH